MVNSNKIETVIFLVGWPFTTNDVEKWGFDTYLKYGFKVQVFDLSRLFNRELLLNHVIENEVVADYIYKIESYAMLSKLLNETASNSVYIDWICFLSDIDWKYAKLYRILKKSALRYFVVYPVALPVSPASQNKLPLLRRFIAKLQRIETFGQIIDFIFRRIAVVLRRNGFYAKPEKIFSGKNETVTLFLRKNNIKEDCLLPIHSFDYDTYLRYSNKKTIDQQETNLKQPYCVFLEEGLTNHCDWDIIGIKPLSAQQYYSEMNRFFSRVEKETGLKVLVAAHPRSDISQISDVFMDREIFQGKTVELVADAVFVITHYSTAVNFAVLFDKPIILVKTSEICQRNMFDSMVDNMSCALGLTPIYTNQESLIISDYIKVSKEKYEEYKNKYIVYRDLPSATVAENVVQEVLRINGKEGNHLYNAR